MNYYIYYPLLEQYSNTLNHEENYNSYTECHKIYGEYLRG